MQSGTSVKFSVRVGMYHGPGANHQAMFHYLGVWGFDPKLVSKDQLLSLDQLNIDVLFLPGGWYHFTEEIYAALRAFVEAGGGVVGSCAGSYLVAGDSGLIPARVLNNNIRGRVYMEPQNGTHPILKHVVFPCKRHNQRQWERIAMTQHGGPMIMLQDRSHQVLSYDTGGEITSLAAADRGKGRAVAIAPHPEYPLAALPAADTTRDKDRPYDQQGQEWQIVRNAVLWAAHREEEIPAEPSNEPAQLFKATSC
jgi:hypothetical protein